VSFNNISEFGEHYRCPFAGTAWFLLAFCWLSWQTTFGKPEIQHGVLFQPTQEIENLSKENDTTTMPKGLKEVWSTVENGRYISLALASPNTLLLRVSRGTKPYKSYALAERRSPQFRYHISQQTGFVEVQTDSLRIQLFSKPFGMIVRDTAGRILLDSPSPALRVEDDAVTYYKRQPKNERVYGMGEVGETFDRALGRYMLWNIDDFSRNPRQNFYCQIPFAIHLNPQSGNVLGLFIDNPGKQFWDLGKTRRGVCSYQTVSGDFSLWLMFNDSFQGVLQQWTDLTGRMTRPPLWALGYHQCRWSYYPESRVREIASEFRRRKIPCDAIYLDIDYMDGYRVFTWHPQRFSSPEKLLADLKAEGFHVVTIVDPGIKIDKDYEVYRDFVTKPGFFCVDPVTSAPFEGPVWPGMTHFPDFTRSDVRQAWGEYQKKALLDKGVDGIWNDMNEPHVFNEKEFPGRVLQYDFGQNSPHAKIHQVYGLTMAQASREGFEKARPAERPFIITRSGWAGVQRYALMWTGDNQSTWASMTLDLQLNLSMGLSGVAFVGCDIGGFAFDCFPELYARWIEWGVFQPFCRTHSAAGTADQEPWSFGQEVEKIARQMIEFRMRLLPYIYTAFVQASETGAPVNQPLVYQYPQDTYAQRVADEFFLGTSLLIAPVLEPAKDRRLVYLPSGTWYHWWSGKTSEGPTFEIVEAPPAQPPLFAKAGSVIPMQDVLQYVDERTLTQTILEVFVAPRMEGVLVEDDGKSLAYREGVELRTEFHGKFTEKQLEFEIGAPQGRFQSPRQEWLLRMHGLPNKPQRVGAGRDLLSTTWSDGVLEVRLKAAPRPVRLTAEF